MILLDTSAIVEFFAGTDRGRRIADYMAREELATSAICVHEVLLGTPDKHTACILEFFETLHIIPFGFEAAQRSSAIEQMLHGRGEFIGKLDVLIASTCLTHDVPLLTCDKGFGRIKELHTILV